MKYIKLPLKKGLYYSQDEILSYIAKLQGMKREDVLKNIASPEHIDPQTSSPQEIYATKTMGGFVAVRVVDQTRIEQISRFIKPGFVVAISVPKIPVRRYMMKAKVDAAPTKYGASTDPVPVIQPAATVADQDIIPETQISAPQELVTV